MITFVATPALTVPDAVTFPLITKISWTLSASTTTLPVAVTFAPLAMRAIALSPTFSTVMVPATDIAAAGSAAYCHKLLYIQFIDPMNLDISIYSFHSAA